jgi:hypothetical protein
MLRNFRFESALKRVRKERCQSRKKYAQTPPYIDNALPTYGHRDTHVREPRRGREDHLSGTEEGAHTLVALRRSSFSQNVYKSLLHWLTARVYRSGSLHKSTARVHCAGPQQASAASIRSKHPQRAFGIHSRGQLTSPIPGFPVFCQDLPYGEFACCEAILWKETVVIESLHMPSHDVKYVSLLFYAKSFDVRREYHVLLPCRIRDEAVLLFHLAGYAFFFQ